MKMEAPAAKMLCAGDDTRNLELLLQTFGSVVSLQDIASAYCQAGRNVYMAGEILCNLQGSTSGSSTSESKDDLNGASESSEVSADPALRKPHAERYSSAPKPKKCAASAGTVSSVIGAEYARSRPSIHEACKVTKPLKLASSEFPVSEIWEVKGPSDNAEALHSGIEEFLFAMLGNGFQLGMDVIREVVGACGYDVEKSMEKLLDMSRSTLEMGDNVVSVKHKGKEKVLGTLECQEISLDRDSTASGEAGSRNGSELPKRGTDKYDLQKEVLQALFTVPDRFEDAPRRIVPKREVKRRTFGKLVAEPLSDTTTEFQFATAKLEVNKDENEDAEDGYEVLRKAVKEHWITMKEYYKAAADAYAKGDHTRAYKFLEKGHFFMERAREANEKSVENLVETRDVEEIMSLDLHDHAPRKAIRLIKLHLTSLSGIPSIRYLKLVVGINDENTKEGTTKRLIKKLLERDSIAYTEEGNGQILMIRVDEINPKRLSFAKKPTVA